MTTTMSAPAYCSDAFILRVTSVEVNDKDKGIDISELEYLESRLLNNYHLVEIDSSECPNFDMAYEIFNSRVYEASEGAIETGEEVVLLTRGNYDDNFEDALPTDKPVIEDL